MAPALLPVVSALEKQKQEGLCEFQAIQEYMKRLERLCLKKRGDGERERERLEVSFNPRVLA